MELEAANEGFVGGVIGEDGEDIFEEDAGGREVRKLAQRSAQLYLKTGEFGGAGGSGGGVSGDLGGGGGIGGCGSGMLGHGERKGRRRRRKEKGREK
jgi:hypothetical protein